MQSYYEEYIEEINNPDQNGQYSMNKDEISSKSKELLDIISNAEKELIEVQSKCRHKDRTVKSVNIRSKSEVRVVCDYCMLIVGYPSTKQIKEWNNT